MFSQTRRLPPCRLVEEPLCPILGTVGAVDLFDGSKLELLTSASDMEQLTVPALEESPGSHRLRADRTNGIGRRPWHRGTWGMGRWLIGHGQRIPPCPAQGGQPAASKDSGVPPRNSNAVSLPVPHPVPWTLVSPEDVPFRGIPR